MFQQQISCFGAVLTSDRQMRSEIPEGDKRRKDATHQKMRSILDDIHLSPPSYNLSARNYSIIKTIYNSLKIGDGIDDVMFGCFLDHVLDSPRKKEKEDIFTLFDTDMGNTVEFDEFYLCVCILIANRDSQMRDFFAANSRTCFDLLDTENLGMITKNQAKHLKFLLGMTESQINKEFEEFDTSHDQALDYEEFRRFTQRCIDQCRTDASDSDSTGEWEDLKFDDTRERCCRKCCGEDCCDKCTECLMGCVTCVLDWFRNWLTDPVTY